MTRLLATPGTATAAWLIRGCGALPVEPSVTRLHSLDSVTPFSVESAQTSECHVGP